MSGGPVNADFARLAPNHIGVETIPIVAIIDIHFFELHQVHRLAKIRVYADRAFIVQIGIGYYRAMDL
jgi:hypothetical protein